MADHQNEQQNEGADYSAPPPLPGVERQVPRELAGLRLDQALARMFPEHSRSRLAGWLRDGHVLIDSTAGTPKQKIWGGERIAVTEPPSPDASAEAEDIALTIVHEDDSVFVINKPAGLVVHPGAGNASGTLMNALLHRAPELAAVPRAGIVHRLDKDTSGLLVVARTLQAQTDLVRQLQARSVKREYLALVHGWVHGDGTVDVPLGRDPRNRVRMSVNTLGGGKEARTRFRVIERYESATLLECSLDTGRTHQIRVHMQSVGHPLVGDPVYRSGRPSLRAAADAIGQFPRQALHATRLAFVHPLDGGTLQFEAPPPPDFAALLAALGPSTLNPSR